MRRVTKKSIVFIFGIIFVYCYCEYFIYYLVIAQCQWPTVRESYENHQALKAFILSDTHLLGPRKGHWMDKWRREWQMSQAFQAIMTLHRPDAVFVLGDLFDEGEWSNDTQFNAYVQRFINIFPVQSDVTMHIVAGNHDIGFHNYIRRGSAERFTKLLNASSVQFLTIKNNHFVLINSMAMEGDSCHLCTNARRQIDRISVALTCSQYPEKCMKQIKEINYSRPILMQHFPLHRLSDAVCTEPDSPPLPEKNKPFRVKIDALSEDATTYLISKIKPRVVFGGHTHHGCFLKQMFKVPETIEFNEYSVPSFSWRNRPDPKYMLVTITPDDYAVQKCGLPREVTIAATAIISMILLALCSCRVNSIGR